MADMRTRVRFRKAVKRLRMRSKAQRTWGLTGDGTGRVEAGSTEYLYVRPEGAGPPVRALNLPRFAAKQGISVELGCENGRYVILGWQPEGAPFFRQPPEL